MTNSIPSPNVNDFSELRSLSVPKDKITPETLRQVAQQFESLFTQEMLKSMRKANSSFSSSMGQSHAHEMYQSMHDEQLSLTLSSKGKGIGLADVLYEQLSATQPTPRGLTAESEHTQPTPRGLTAGSEHTQPTPRGLTAGSEHTQPTPRGLTAGSEHTQPTPRGLTAGSEHTQPTPRGLTAGSRTNNKV